MTDTAPQPGALAPKPPVSSRYKNLAPGQPIPLTADQKKAQATLYLDYWREATTAAKPGEQTLARDREEYSSKAELTYDNSILTDPTGRGITPRVRIPVMRATVRAWCAQMLETLFGDPPHLYVSAGPNDDADDADAVEGYLAWWCETYGEWGERFLAVLEEVAVAGVAYWHIPYRVERKYEIYRESAPPPSNPIEAFVRKLFPQQQPLKAGWRVCYDGPRLEVVPRERLHCYPPEQSDLDKAAALFYEYRVTAAEVQRGRKGQDGAPALYYLTDEEYALAFGTGGSGDDPNDKTARRVDTAAVDVYCDWDWTGDGESVPVLLTILPDSGVLIRATPAPLGGYRPFVPFWRTTDGGKTVRTSIPDEIRHLCFVINERMTQYCVHAQWAMLMAQTGFYPAGSGFDPSKGWVGTLNALKGDRSGSPVAFVQVPSLPDILNGIELCYSQIQKATGISENYMGGDFAVQRTATEAEAVQANGNVIFDMQAKTLAQCVRRAAQLIARQFRTNGPAVLSYSEEAIDEQTGETVQRQKTVPAEAFSPSLVFTAAGASANMNTSAQAQKWMLYAKLMTNDPFVNADGSRAWALREMLAKKLGIDNYKRIIGEQPEPNSPLPVPALPPQGAPQGPQPHVTLTGQVPPGDVEALLGVPGGNVPPGMPEMPGPAGPMAGNPMTMPPGFPPHPFMGGEM